MKIRVSELLRWDGTIDRWPYFVAGVWLAVLKVGLEYLVATRIFHREWTPFEYWAPVFNLMFRMNPADMIYFRTMSLVPLPFVACGLALSVRRLRSAGMPLYAVALLFAPLPLNMILFLVLSMIPPRTASSDSLALIDADWPDLDSAKKSGTLGKAVPESKWRAAIVAIVVPMPCVLGLGAICYNILPTYGWGAIVGIPFTMPMISVILYGYHTRRRLSECLALGMLWLFVALIVCLVLLVEGIICLIMGLPLFIPLALLGSAVGYLVQSRLMTSRETSRMVFVLMAALPMMIGAESAMGPQAPIFTVSSRIEIAATPQRVWDHLVEFDRLPEPDDWVFQTGIGYPICATLEGRGVGAVRQCVFSTGPAIEPIDVWDEPRRLRFEVTSSPPPMREWNPFAEIHPPHLDGFLVARSAEFRFTEIAGGRTLLEGTSRYQHYIWPTAYWRLWSDAIILRIHRRVFDYVKRSSESEERLLRSHSKASGHARNHDSSNDDRGHVR